MSVRPSVRPSHSLARSLPRQWPPTATSVEMVYTRNGLSVRGPRLVRSWHRIRSMKLREKPSSIYRSRRRLSFAPPPNTLLWSTRTDCAWACETYRIDSHAVCSTGPRGGELATWTICRVGDTEGETVTFRCLPRFDPIVCLSIYLYIRQSSIYLSISLSPGIVEMRT